MYQNVKIGKNKKSVQKISQLIGKTKNTNFLLKLVNKKHMENKNTIPLHSNSGSNIFFL